jgi:TolA-binding protein
MQAQDTATAYFLKLWSWVETHIKQVVLGLGLVAIAIALIAYYSWRQNQMEIEAGQALTQVLIAAPDSSDATQTIDAYFKVSADYPSTQSGQRALVLAATGLFTGGKYVEAQAQFQKYLDTYPGGAFSASAALGIASSLEAQGKTDPAASAYQRVISGFSDPNADDTARFALAKIDEQHGKLTEAENLYQDVARSNPNTPLGSEAAFRAFQLRTKSPATSSASTSPAPFTLSTQP